MLNIYHKRDYMFITNLIFDLAGLFGRLQSKCFKWANKRRDKEWKRNEHMYVGFMKRALGDDFYNDILAGRIKPLPKNEKD